MKQTKLLLSIIVMLTITYLGLEIFNKNFYSDYVRWPIIPLLTYVYYLKTKDKSSFFFLFLLMFSICEFTCGISNIIYEFTESTLVDTFQFFSGNIMYILGYTFLILEIIKDMKLKHVFKKFLFTIIVLLALDTYSVVLVSKVSIESGYFESVLGMVIEVIYNTIIMLLLSVSLINYLYRDSRKAINLLLASTCIVFSEIIQGAYIYVSDLNILKVLGSVFMLAAFVLLYIQATMSYQDVKFKVFEQKKMLN